METRIRTAEWRRVFKRDGAELLTVTQRYPQWEGTGRGARRFDRYYAALAQRWRRRWEEALLARARADPQAGGWTAELSYTVSCERDGLLSLVLDAREDEGGGGRPRLVRQGDLWRMPQGEAVPLTDLLPRRRRRRGLLAQVEEQLRAQLASGEHIFYEDAPRLAAKTLSAERAYLTETGAAVFYPLYAIAPYAEGIPVFPISLEAPHGPQNKDS